MNEKNNQKTLSGFSIVAVAPNRPNQLDASSISRIKALQANEINHVGGLVVDGLVKAGKSLHTKLSYSSYLQKYYEKTGIVLERLCSEPDFRPPLVKFSAVKDTKINSDEILNYRMFQSDVKLVRTILENSGFNSTEGHDWNLLWIGHNPKANFYEKVNIYQKISHFPNSFEITRKDRLCSSISKMQEQYGKEAFNFVPDTYILPDDFSLLYSNFSRDKKSLWIVKPACSSQGRGIYLIDSISEVPIEDSCIISRYISNPLLINSLKFDLRIYVLVTSYEPLRIYIYQEGLARFASETYKPGCKNNRFMHLTNYSLNKKSENFVQNEDFRLDDSGHKWSMSAIMKLFESQGFNTDLLWKNIYDLIIKTIISGENSVIETCHKLGIHRNCCFDLLGFDVLIDSNLKPWLLEVNLSPSLAIDSPLDVYIKTNLLLDTFNLIGLRKYDKKKDNLAKFRPISKNIKARSCRSQSPGSKRDFSSKFREVLKETLEEQTRCGHFIRIYPSKGSNCYDEYFSTPRPLNQNLYKTLYIEIMQEPEILNQIKLRPMTCSIESEPCPPISPQKLSFKRPISTETSQKVAVDSVEEKFSRCKNCKNSEFICSYCKLLKCSKEEKIVVTSDDVLIEYLNRLTQVLKNSKESTLKAKWKKKLNNFIVHPAWITPDQDVKIWKRLANRQQEMKDRKRKLVSVLKKKRVINDETEKSEVLGGIFRKFNSNEIENILMASSRNVAFELVKCIVEEESGILTEMLTQGLKNENRLDSPNFEETEYGQSWTTYGKVFRKKNVKRMVFV